MSISTNRIRSWLRRFDPAHPNTHPIWLPVAACFFVAWLVTMGLGVVLTTVQAQSFWQLSEAQRITNLAIDNSAASTFTNPLDDANFIQITLNPGDAQAFTYCPPEGGDCAVVPSGSAYQIGPLRRQLRYGQVLGTAQTATDAATLQIVAQRVQ